jgi:hypothetical protein
MSSIHIKINVQNTPTENRLHLFFASTSGQSSYLIIFEQRDERPSSKPWHGDDFAAVEYRAQKNNEQNSHDEERVLKPRES